jgi:hypothetical protein
MAERAFVDQLDPGAVERRHQLHQRVYVAPNHAVAGLHPLDGRHGQARQRGQLALVHADQGAGGSQLGSRDYGRPSILLPHI